MPWASSRSTSLPGRRMKTAGVDGAVVAVALVVAVVGFFVVPVVGAPLGFVLAIYVLELVKHREHARGLARDDQAIRAVALNIGIELRDRVRHHRDLGRRGLRHPALTPPGETPRRALPTQDPDGVRQGSCADRSRRVVRRHHWSRRRFSQRSSRRSMKVPCLAGAGLGLAGARLRGAVAADGGELGLRGRDGVDDAGHHDREADRTEPDAAAHRGEDDEGQARRPRPRRPRRRRPRPRPRDFVFSMREANRGSSA